MNSFSQLYRGRRGPSSSAVQKKIPGGWAGPNPRIAPIPLPLPPTPPTPYPTPMPTHTRPPTPHLSHPRRSPSSQAEGAGLAPKEDHHKVQSHFNGPISRRSPSSPRCGCRACPKGGPPQGAVPLQRPNPPPGPNPQAKAAGRLVSLCRFPAISAQALGLRSARALPDTTCLPFSTVSTPPSGALGPSSRPCLADTTCLPLSTCPTRLNPKLRRPLPGTGRPEIRAHTIPIKSNRPLPCRRCRPVRLTLHRQCCYPPTHISTKRSEGE